MAESQVPQELLNYGSITVAWHRAVATEDIVIGYPAPRPACIYVAGTRGWWNGAGGGSFLPDGNTIGISMGRHALDIERESVRINYTPDYWRYEEQENDDDN